MPLIVLTSPLLLYFKKKNKVTDVHDYEQSYTTNNSSAVNQLSTSGASFLTQPANVFSSQSSINLLNVNSSNNTLTLPNVAYERILDLRKFIPKFIEIPRQQEEESGEPEVMQFKATQKLFNPTQKSPYVNTNYFSINIILFFSVLPTLPIIDIEDRNEIKTPKRFDYFYVSNCISNQFSFHLHL